MDATAAQNAVDTWNAQHPVGTAVLAYPLRAPREGTPVTTTTRSAAWLHAGTALVVLIHGRAGFVTLESLKVVR